MYILRIEAEVICSQNFNFILDVLTLFSEFILDIQISIFFHTYSTLIDIEIDTDSCPFLSSINVVCGLTVI